MTRRDELAHGLARDMQRALRAEAHEVRRAQRSDARRNRDRVLEAAWRLLSTKSPDDVSMEEVAREADIGKGTLYRHYPNKECLFEAIVGAGADHIVADLRTKIPPEADAVTKLRTMIAVIYDAYERFGINVDFLLNAHRLNDIRRPIDAAHPVAPIMNRLRAILEQGEREGTFRSLDLDYTSMAIFSLLNPIAFIKLRDRLGYDRHQLEEAAADLIVHALRR